jgi:hypothetical protein
MILLQKEYDGESIIDAPGDFQEALDPDFNSTLSTIPADGHGFSKGTFKVTIEWTPDKGD